MQAMKRYVGPEARATSEAVRPPHVCSESSGLHPKSETPNDRTAALS